MNGGWNGIIEGKKGRRKREKAKEEGKEGESKGWGMAVYSVETTNDTTIRNTDLERDETVQC